MSKFLEETSVSVYVTEAWSVFTNAGCFFCILFFCVTYLYRPKGTDMTTRLVLMTAVAVVVLVRILFVKG